MGRARSGLLSLLLVLFWTDLSACAESLKVGVAQSLTGIAYEDGTTVVRALRLAASDLQKTGTSVELLIEDDATSPKKTVAAYQRLKAEGVGVIFGATWDFTTIT